MNSPRFFVFQDMKGAWRVQDDQDKSLVSVHHDESAATDHCQTLNNRNALAEQCAQVIEAAEADGLTITDAEVVDLCADNVRADLSEIRSALALRFRYTGRFRRAWEARS